MAFPQTNITLSQICIAYGLAAPYKMSDLRGRTYFKDGVQNTVPSSGSFSIGGFRGATVSAPTVPGNFPSKTLSSGTRSITFRWSAPSDGGSPITVYHIKLYKDGNSITTDVDPSTGVNGLYEYVWGDLGNGTYQGTGWSCNAVGCANEQNFGTINV